MSSEMKSEWRMEQGICSYDVDPHQNVRLPALCRFMQEAAYLHAAHLGLGHEALAAGGMAWVLARLRITVERLPMWGDTVKIRTWPSGRDRLFFYRDFEITDGDGNRVLTAANAWALIDIERRARVHPGHYLQADIPEGVPLFSSRPARLKGGASSTVHDQLVTYGDLDLNGHVNNVRYIEWVLDGLPQGFHEMHRIRELECNYMAEAVYGQSISVCEEERAVLEYSHSIKSDESELFRAHTVWERVGES